MIEKHLEAELSLRTYDPKVDFERVGRWLERTYRREGQRVNWLQPRWEYMHYHPQLDELGPAALESARWPGCDTARRDPGAPTPARAPL